MNEADFQSLIWEKGRELYRDMPWRHDTSPYYVLVSELMLQQTQVSRVIPKFEVFMNRFSDLQSLAEATLSDVLREWSGLGYNRRAKYLHEAAKKIVADHDGQFPSDDGQIKALPGIGPATAGAIAAYAFNRPVVFIETNVRTVYFHHFFEDHTDISDAQLRPLLERTLSRKQPREFYWALMDYGSWLKKHSPSARNSQSRHYKRQSRFEGSLRETRGQIIRLLAESEMALPELEAHIGDERFLPAIEGLLSDGLVGQAGETLYLGREMTK